MHVGSDVMQKSLQVTSLTKIPALHIVIKIYKYWKHKLWKVPKQLQICYSLWNLSICHFFTPLWGECKSRTAIQDCNKKKKKLPHSEVTLLPKYVFYIYFRKRRNILKNAISTLLSQIYLLNYKKMSFRLINFSQ